MYVLERDVSLPAPRERQLEDIFVFRARVVGELFAS